MTSRTITHVSPTLQPLFVALAESLAEGELIPPTQFTKHFPPSVLAACLASEERAVLRGIVLNQANGTEPEFGQESPEDQVAGALATVLRKSRNRYELLRMQISHIQFVEIAPIGALIAYFTETRWWDTHWNKAEQGDVNASSAKALIAALTAIDVNDILTAAEKFAAITPAILSERLDEITVRGILQSILFEEHLNSRLKAGEASMTTRKHAPNAKLVSLIPPGILMKVIWAAINKYANAEERPSETDEAFSDTGPLTIAQGRGTLSPPRANGDLPPVLGGPPAENIPAATVQHAESAPPAETYPEGGGSGDSPSPFGGGSEEEGVAQTSSDPAAEGGGDLPTPGAEKHNASSTTQMGLGENPDPEGSFRLHSGERID